MGRLLLILTRALYRLANRKGDFQMKFVWSRKSGSRKTKAGKVVRVKGGASVRRTPLRSKKK